MFTVTSQLLLTVRREDDGIPVVCQVEHPAVKDMQTKHYLDVMCEYLSPQSLYAMMPLKKTIASDESCELMASVFHWV